MVSVLQPPPPQKREKMEKKRGSHLPNPSFPPPSEKFWKWWVEQREESQSTICLWQVNWFPRALPFLSLFPLYSSALRAAHYTCLPSASADGRGWDLCPNLCFDLPGKVERKGAKGARTLRTSHHVASAPQRITHSSYPSRGRALSEQESGFARDCWCWLKVWIGHWINLDTYWFTCEVVYVDVADVFFHLAAASLH